MNKSLIEAVRRANDIVEVVQSYVPLKHVGSNWRGICPFHNDTNPSMYVSQPKQIFKCFACGKAGNVFTFVQEYEKLTFVEALKKLAARVGMSVPEYGRTKTVSTKREQLLVVYASARDFFAQNLFDYGQNALKYLQKRSFSPETAKTLELGFSLNSEKGLLNHLLKEGNSVSLLKESGLFGNYSGNLLDFFRGRLMFPIHNNIGEVIAFGGRIFEEDSKFPKYVNSSGTELYTKGRELYGLFKTKYEISKSGAVLVSEGYFDFLRLYENGFLNSVACLGTAMTEDQVYLLSRYSPKVYMLFDGDSAGVSNAVRGALLSLGKGLEAHIVELPKNHDPDSFLLEEGADALRERIDAAKPVLRYIAEMDSQTPASDRIDQALDALRGLRDPIKRELFARDLAEAFGVSTRAVFSKLRRTSTSRRTAAAPAPTPVLEEDLEERHVLILALQDEEAFNLFAQTLSPDYFNNRLYQEFFKFLMAEADAESISEPATLLDNIENKDLRDLLAEFLFSDPPQVEFGKALDQIRLRKLQRDMRDLDRRIQAAPEDIRLLEEKRKLALAYRSLSGKVVKGLLI